MTDFLTALAARKREEAHSIYSPSAAHRWSRCLGSLVANAVAPDHATFYAAEGTVAHKMADLWLTTGERPSHMVGKTVKQEGFWITIDDQMLSYVEEYVEDVRATPGWAFYEQRVDHSSVTPIPYQKGTADNFVLRHGSFTVRDFKYGKGRPVYIRKADGKLNEQFGLYAVAVFDQWDWYYDFQTIEMQVSQPRVPNFDRETITREELLAFKAYIRERAYAAWRVDAPRTPGDHCTDCGAIKDCPAYLTWFAALRDEEADAVFDLPALTEAAHRAEDPFEDAIPLPELSVEAWCRILPMRKAVEAWFAAGEAKVFGAAQAGFDTPGYKIVEGRANRDWSNPEKAQARMVEAGIPLDETETRKLLSPNQAEEALHRLTRMAKKKAAGLFESLTERKDGGLSLVRVSDKRDAVESHGSVFDGDDYG